LLFFIRIIQGRKKTREKIGLENTEMKMALIQKISVMTLIMTETLDSSKRNSEFRRKVTARTNIILTDIIKKHFRI